MADKTFFVSTATPSVAGANKAHLTLWNNATGKIIKVYKITACGSPTVAVTGLVIPLIAQRILNVAPTGGTALTPKPAGTTAGVWDALPSGITAATGSTVLSANEEGVAFGIGEVSGEEAIAPYKCVLYEYLSDWTKPVELAVGQGMMVKQGALASAGAVSIHTLFAVV